jgi:hypothetical protein
MTFDIISLSDEEITALSTIQLKLLRTAQQSKDKLYHTLQQDIQTYKLLTYTNGVAVSSLFEDKSKELTEEYEYQVAILKEQLIFNMSLNEPTNDGETGESGSDNTGYLVDYSLSYLERYIEVRDYYMSIEDPNERLALYAADTVAQAYLGSYYTGLYDYFSTFT